jgi:hypothetical protein
MLLMQVAAAAQHNKAVPEVQVAQVVVDQAVVQQQVQQQQQILVVEEVQVDILLLAHTTQVMAVAG